MKHHSTCLQVSVGDNDSIFRETIGRWRILLLRNLYSPRASLPEPTSKRFTEVSDGLGGRDQKLIAGHAKVGTKKWNTKSNLILDILAIACTTRSSWCDRGSLTCLTHKLLVYRCCIYCFLCGITRCCSRDRYISPVANSVSTLLALALCQLLYRFEESQGLPLTRKTVSELGEHSPLHFSATSLFSRLNHTCVVHSLKSPDTRVRITQTMDLRAIISTIIVSLKLVRRLAIVRNGKNKNAEEPTGRLRVSL